MPRIYDGFSNPLDFCRKHFPSYTEALNQYGAGTGPDNHGNCFAYDADHPDYEGDDYTCDHKGCNKLLTHLDD